MSGGEVGGDLGVGPLGGPTSESGLWEAMRQARVAAGSDARAAGSGASETDVWAARDPLTVIANT